MLSDGEKCGCKLLEAFDITQPTLSHHMKILCECGLVNDRKVAPLFYKNEVVWDSKMDLSGYETLLSNYSEQNIEEGKITLKPYEAVMLYKK